MSDTVTITISRGFDDEMMEVCTKALEEEK